MNEASHLAVFSCEAAGTAIHVAPADNLYSPVASSHPSNADNPLVALREMGWSLAYQSQKFLFESTMQETGYRKVYVVPTN